MNTLGDTEESHEYEDIHLYSAIHDTALVSGTGDYNITSCPAYATTSGQQPGELEYATVSSQQVQETSKEVDDTQAPEIRNYINREGQ